MIKGGLFLAGLGLALGAGLAVLQGGSGPADRGAAVRVSLPVPPRPAPVPRVAAPPATETVVGLRTVYEYARPAPATEDEAGVAADAAVDPEPPGGRAFVMPPPDPGRAAAPPPPAVPLAGVESRRLPPPGVWAPQVRVSSAQ